MTSQLPAPNSAVLPSAHTTSPLWRRRPRSQSRASAPRAKAAVASMSAHTRSGPTTVTEATLGRCPPGAGVDDVGSAVRQSRCGHRSVPDRDDGDDPGRIVRVLDPDPPARAAGHARCGRPGHRRPRGRRRCRAARRRRGPRDPRPSPSPRHSGRGRSRRRGRHVVRRRRRRTAHGRARRARGPPAPPRGTPRSRARGGPAGRPPSRSGTVLNIRSAACRTSSAACQAASPRSSCAWRPRRARLIGIPMICSTRRLIGAVPAGACVAAHRFAWSSALWRDSR